MARAAKVKPGQVWADARGRHLQVLNPPGPDGKFQVKNLESGRTMLRGPRALVSMVQDSPYGQGMPPAVARTPHYNPLSEAPEYGYDPYEELELPAPHQAPPRPAPVRRPVPPQFAKKNRPPPPRRSPAPRAVVPINGGPHRGNPTSYPSPLTQFLAERLAAIPPQNAHSPAMVRRAFAAAMAEWDSLGRRDPGEWGPGGSGLSNYYP